MLTGVHFLMTYTCNYSCDHCFLYCGPEAKGTMNFQQIVTVLEDSRRLGTVEWIYFEGGEPLLHYPVLLKSVAAAKKMGFSVGVVTNGYGISGKEEAEIWLRPLAEAGVDLLAVSDDTFHCGEHTGPAGYAKIAADGLALAIGEICIEKPYVEAPKGNTGDKGNPVIGGGAMFRGRAAEKLTEGLPSRAWEELASCPYENLESPGRVHVDCFGNVHLCQGISLGNMWKRSLTELIREYDAAAHPICDALVNGGPAQLAKLHNVKHAERYVDECHFCFFLRRSLLEMFPEYLGPRQVYGVENT